MAVRMTQQGGVTFEAERVATIAGAGAAARHEAVARREAGATGTAALAALAAALLILWSLTYLYRQPAVEGAAFSPFGDFALEGMLLAAAWLGSLATFCLAALGGMVEFRVPGEAPGEGN